MRVLRIILNVSLLFFFCVNIFKIFPAICTIVVIVHVNTVKLARPESTLNAPISLYSYEILLHASSTTTTAKYTPRTVHRASVGTYMILERNGNKAKRNKKTE